jgi:ferrochelatase
MTADPVLLVNLGSPDSPAPDDVRDYLREFLMDGRVIDIPEWRRHLIVHLAILPFRTRHAARLYQSIWTPQGSPLVVHGVRLAERLAATTGRRVEVAMRYGRPSIEEALTRFVAAGASRVTVVPLFPQYAEATVGSAVAHLAAIAVERHPSLALRMVGPYFEEPRFIAALAATARPILAGGFDHLLVSFHSLPERQIRKADPTGAHCLVASDCCRDAGERLATCYRAQCLRTAELVGAALALEPNHLSVSFQSKMGRGRWLDPATEDEIRRLAGEGVRRLAVIAPSFAADCLETIEELGVRGRQAFLDAGGRDFVLAPCLNDDPAWVEALGGMIAAAEKDGLMR